MKRTIRLLLIGPVLLVVAYVVATVGLWPQNRAKVSSTAPVSPTPLPLQAVPAESAWLNDYKKAQEEAKANNKFLLLNFTGSDWCGWCIKFDKEVLSQPEFKDYARNNLVLVELDFPRRKPQPVELKKQNLQLAQRYQVFGFPTIVVLNSDGQKLWKFDGYFPGGPEAFIAELEKLRKS